MRQKLLLLAAVFFGLLAFMFTYQQINMEKRRIQSAAEEVQLVQAKVDMSAGDVVTEDKIQMFKGRRFTQGGGASLDIPWRNKNSILGQKLDVAVPKGTTLQYTYFKITRKAGREGLTQFVRPGFRAISIPVDATSSVTGLVQPNNYVDLIGTFRFPDTKGDQTLDTITLTLLQNVRVLATGTDLGYLGPNAGGNNMMPVARSYSTVTLELTPKEVEMIVFATQKGRLVMSLRNYEELSFDKNLQSVDWGVLKKDLQRYNQEREQKFRAGGSR